MAHPSPNPRPYLIRTAAAGLTILTAGRPVLFALGGPALPPAGSAEQQRLALEDYTFAHDDILGTSLDLIVCAARPGDAVRCQEEVLGEIERLRAILSTYDPTSEISRVSQGLQPATAPELRRLLAAYDDWSARTGGLVDPRLNQVVRLWREAARTGQVPAAAELRAALNAPGALNVDALGKAYIIDQAVALARRLVPAGLVNIGGDLRAWGDRTWQIGVADPLSPAENAPLLATFPLRDAAVATSGDYARPLVIADRSYSHLIDPRTLQPVADVRSATVVATDCVTANALAAALSVLGPPGAAGLADLGRALGHLMVDRGGGIARGGSFATVADPAAPTTPASPDSSPPEVANSAATAPSRAASAGTPASAQTVAPWPKNFQVTVNLVIGAPAPAAGTGAAGGRGGRVGKRPYIVIWVKDAQRKFVRTVCLFGNNSNYQSDLTTWYAASAPGGDDDFIHSVSRATRAPGTYPVVWDGTDDFGKPVPQGTYTITVEINREDGRHVSTNTSIVCEGVPHAAELTATVETGVSQVSYGPRVDPAPP